MRGRMMAFALVAIGVATGWLSTPAQAQAQDYPSRRITFVVPYPPGGATDVAARILAQSLSERWKQTVTVENRAGGGGGIVGNDFVAKSEPDGYTVLIGITNVIQAPAVGTKLPYDPFKDLAPVTQVALSTIVFCVPAASPAKTMQDFIAEAKKGKLSYGSFGNATTSHLFGELIKKKAGFEMTHVPYRGAAPLTNDVIGGQVDGGYIDYTTAGPQIQAGKVRALAVGGEKRSPILPDVPTMGELGFQGFEAEGWVGVFVPAATAAPIVKKLSDELASIIKSPEVAEKIKATGLVPVGNSFEEFNAVLRRDYERWRVTAETAGVSAE